MNHMQLKNDDVDDLESLIKSWNVNLPAGLTENLLACHMIDSAKVLMDTLTEVNDQEADKKEAGEKEESPEPKVDVTASPLFNKAVTSEKNLLCEGDFHVIRNEVEDKGVAYLPESADLTKEAILNTLYKLPEILVSFSKTPDDIHVGTVKDGDFTLFKAQSNYRQFMLMAIFKLPTIGENYGDTILGQLSASYPVGFYLKVDSKERVEE